MAWGNVEMWNLFDADDAVGDTIEALEDGWIVARDDEARVGREGANAGLRLEVAGGVECLRDRGALFQVFVQIHVVRREHGCARGQPCAHELRGPGVPP